MEPVSRFSQSLCICFAYQAKKRFREVASAESLPYTYKNLKLTNASCVNFDWTDCIMQ